MTAPRTNRRPAILRAARSVQRAFGSQFGSAWQWMVGFVRLIRFAGEYWHFRRLNLGSRFRLDGGDIIPYLLDRLETTPIEPTYFFQDTWFAERIAIRQPESHVDVASSAKTMAIVAQFVPVQFIDIRPVAVVVNGFTMRPGSVLQLPFADRSIASLSSLCVIEHIGLGRYGDPFDAQGSEKAAAELRRVLASGGDLYVSVPVDSECRVYFNAHRAFTRDYLLSLFAGLELVQERYIYGFATQDAYDPALGFGTGLFHLRAR
jgi:SAM-dependent methyltransferase